MLQCVVLDGGSGMVLWSLNTTQYEMTSDLVLHTAAGPHRDAFMFRVRGRQAAGGGGGAGASGHIAHGNVQQPGDTHSTGSVRIVLTQTIIISYDFNIFTGQMENFSRMKFSFYNLNCYS